jgi:hypothetical protein
VWSSKYGNLSTRTKNISYKQQTCSKILNVINAETVLKRAALCTKKLNPLSRTTMGTTGMPVTFKAKLDTAIPTEA